MLTQTGTMPIGVVINGVRHQDFELRPPTVADNVEAGMEVGADSNVRLSTAVYARQMVRLGTLPAEAINLDLLMAMNPVDWEAINRADEELRKKLLSGGQACDGGSPAAPSLPVTA